MMNTQANALPTPCHFPTTPAVARTPSVPGAATAARLFTTVTPTPKLEEFYLVKALEKHGQEALILIHWLSQCS